jgi:hypothetical protein
VGQIIIIIIIDHLFRVEGDENRLVEDLLFLRILEDLLEDLLPKDMERNHDGWLALEVPQSYRKGSIQARVPH